MLNLALLSYWHVHANDYARQADAHPDTQVVAVWDENAERGQREATARGVPFHANLADLLADANIHGVIVTTPTSMHHEVMRAAAQAGKHIFTEKVIAATTAEATAIVAAAHEANVTLVVSLPRIVQREVIAILAALAAGTIGTPTYARVRLAHDGGLNTTQRPNGWLPAHFYNPEEAQGGALMDLGCHPVYLLRAMLGMPTHVSTTFGAYTARAVDDNAVAVFRYANGAIGVAESGFVSRGEPIRIEIHGTDGNIVFGAPHKEPQIATRDADWQPLPVAEDAPSAFHQWVDAIQHGTSVEENVALALDLTRLMEAAYASAASGTPTPPAL